MMDEIIAKEKEIAEEFQRVADTYTEDRSFKEMYKNIAGYHIAIANILRKYQKIEKITNHWINEDSVGMSDYWMGRIKEVLEDEKGGRK